MTTRKINRYLCIVLFALSACSDDVKHGKIDPAVWIAQFKQSVQEIIAWFTSSPQSATKEEKPVEKVEPNPESNMQAQVQIMGAMENMAALPTNNGADSSWTADDIAQYHQDYNQAITADEKRDALIILVKADAKNAATILRDAYADVEPEVRKEAVLQMHAFNNQKAVVDLLLTALNDPDASVAIEAVEGLANVHDKRVIASLKKIAAGHPDELIRAVAQDYVGSL